MKPILLSLAVAILVTGCSDNSESLPETDTAPLAQNDTTQGFALWTYTDQEQPYAIALTGVGTSTDPLHLVILEELETAEGLKRRPIQTAKGQPADFPIPLADLKGQPLSNPLALLAVREPSEQGVQHLFIVFDGASQEASDHALGEILLDLNSLDTTTPVKMGRIFSLPLHGSLLGVTLSSTPADPRIAVNVPAPTGDPTQPVILVYDIGPDARMLEPIDILMVPKN